MNFLALYITFLGTVIYFTMSYNGVNGAEHADEIIFNYVGNPEKNDLFNVNSRFSRVNRTHQIMNGNLTFLRDFTDDNGLEVNIYRQDHGGWHGMVQRFFEKQCETLLTTDGFGYPFKTLLFKVLPDKCPVTAGTFNATKVMPRYRREWSQELQKLIPVLVPSADKWRIDVASLNGDKQVVALLRVEFRLINKFSSQ